MRIVPALLIVLLGGAAAAAQTNTGQISGVVRDSQGGVLPGATITAEHVATGTKVERVSDDRGRYFLPLDARRGRIPLGFLPQPVREALARRRALLALAGGSAA